MTNKFVALGSQLAFFAVALGAFGAHALKDRLDPYHLEVFKTGVEYQFLHAIGLLIVGLLWQKTNSLWLRRSGWLFTMGIVVFSGSLYTLAFTGIKWLGAITPLGGLCFLLGWQCLFFANIRSNRNA